MGEKKSRYTPAQARASKKYLSEKDEIRIRIPKGQKSIYKDAAAAVGLSLNQYAIDALNEKLDRQKHT